MKKHFIVAMAMIVLILIAIPRLKAEDNSAIAKEYALQKRQGISQEIIRAVETASQDGQVTYQEMLQLPKLQKKLADFDDAYVAIFNEKPDKAAIENGFTEMLDDYFEHLWVRDRDGLVKAFFLSQTDKDIQVLGHFGPQGFGVAILLALVIGLISFGTILLGPKNRVTIGVCLFGIIIIALFLWSLLA